MTARTTRLTDRQRELVSMFAVTDDNRATFTGTDHIPDWAAVKKVMVALGGTWKTGKPTGAFLFAEDVDAREVLRLAAQTGEILDPLANDFYPTPRALADELAASLRLTAGMRVLEPSAGKGALVDAVCRVGAGLHIEAYEILPANYDALVATGTCERVTQSDFLTVKPAPTFDAVIMNPPFTKRADIHHITHALKFLRPGGRLAAIASASVAYRDDNLGRRFRELIAAHGGEFHNNADGTFAESGTNVRTVWLSALGLKGE